MDYVYLELPRISSLRIVQVYVSNASQELSMYPKLWRPTSNVSKFLFYFNIAGDLWTAPEILRTRDTESSTVLQGTPLADIYSFGVIIQEIVTREGPFAAQLISLDAQGKNQEYNKQFR